MNWIWIVLSIWLTGLLSITWAEARFRLNYEERWMPEVFQFAFTIFWPVTLPVIASLWCCTFLFRAVRRHGESSRLRALERAQERAELARRRQRELEDEQSREAQRTEYR